MPPSTPDPAWLVRLRNALFAQPGWAREDDAFVWEEETYVCQRALVMDGTRVLFKETWLDPRTLQQQKTWQWDIDAASWVTPMNDTVFNQQLAFLMTHLPQARPRRPIRPERREFNPYRFARAKQGGQR